MDRVPVVDPVREYRLEHNSIDEAVRSVLHSGHYVLGSQVAAFEEEFARFTGAEHAVGVASGTDAVSLALLAGGVRRGDEVITVSHTAVATVAAIAAIGAVPILVDIEPATMTLDPERVEEAVTDRTAAVVVVHLYGAPADVHALAGLADRHHLLLVEDCAQAHGASVGRQHVGNFGHAGAFSFYPTKNLSAIGDAGAVITNDPELAHRLRAWRQYGWNTERESLVPGWNSRLDEVQAAILRVKLQSLPERLTTRRRIAATYLPVAAPAGTVQAVPGNAEHAFHLFVIRPDSRDHLREHMATHGIDTAIHYPVPVHRQPGFATLSRAESLDITESTVERIVTLPLYPTMTDAEISRVVAALESYDKS